MKQSYEQRALLKKRKRAKQLEEIQMWIALLSAELIFLIMLLVQWSQEWGCN